MEQNERKAKNSEEVDLSQFFRWIGDGFRNAGNSVLRFLATLRQLFFRNKLFFAAIIILGLIVGAIYSELLKKKFYKSTMVLACDYLNKQIMDNTMDKLNMLAGDPSGEGLSALLGIDAETAKNIISFESKSFVTQKDIVEIEILREQLLHVTADKRDLVEKVIDRLEVDNKNAYEISVLLYDPHQVKPLEKGLVNYFNTNSYVRRRMESNTLNLKQRKEKLLEESTKLDSLKMAHFLQASGANGGSNNVLLGEHADPVNVYKLDLDLNKELLKIEERLYVTPDFEVVDSFSAFTQPESAGLAKILLYAFLISVTVGYLIIGVWKFDRMLANYPTNR